MPNYTSKKISFNTAEQFKESFFEPEPATLGYIFLGNHVAWTDEGSPPTTLDTVSNEKSIWDNMFAGKRITGSDVELVLPRVNWTGNTKYRQFDDTIELLTLTSSNTAQNLKQFMLLLQIEMYICVFQIIYQQIQL